MNYLTNKIPQIIIAGLSIISFTFAGNMTAGAQGFSSVTALEPVNVAKNTGEKPQSKVWKYDGKWWAVFPVSTGTYIWRLDGTSWTSTLKISSSKTVKADCKVVDNVCHILLWRKSTSPSQLISVEYDPSSESYQRWAERPTTSYIELDNGTETGTIDIDGRGRMWLTSDGTDQILVRWSDYPYVSWSDPITIETGVTDDDIAAVIALPVLQQVGILWSNQNARRFGFKTHRDDDPPTVWSSDEVPSSQSALDFRDGMSDDHLNLAASTDGTLFCAVKTGYDKPGYPTISLLKRHPDGTWDDLYGVTSDYGTRGIVILNETLGKLKVIYASSDDDGDILYRESSTDQISFGDEYTLVEGLYNNPTSTKSNYDPDIIILASDNTKVVGVLATDIQISVIPDTPELLAPTNLSSEVITSPTLSWAASANAISYHIQVSLLSDFSETVVDQDSIETVSYDLIGLLTDTIYYWRVQAMNPAGASDWTDSWAFSTISIHPETPTLQAPADITQNVGTDPTLVWTNSAAAAYYTVQVSSSADFVTMIVNETTTDTSYQVPLLQNNSIYYWRVQAHNAAGSSKWTDAWSFKTLGSRLVGLWKMDSDGSMLLDSSGFGNHATLFGEPVKESGIIDTALRFNGDDQFALVENNSSLDASQSITLAAWIRPEKMASQRIIEKGSRELTGGYELTLLSTGKVSFRFNETISEAYKVNSRTLYPTDAITWMHIAATFDGSDAKIYINGNLDRIATFSPPQVIESNTMPLTICGKADYSSLFMGTIDDVRLYNYALSEDEVLTLATPPGLDARLITNISEEPVEENTIVAYPIPATNSLNIVYDPSTWNDISISIVDMQGIVHANKATRIAPGKLEVDLNKLDLDVGTFFLIARSGRRSTVIRIIKE